MSDQPPFPPDEPKDWHDWAEWQSRRLRLRRSLPFASHQRPHWWPENEPWPPQRGRLRHNPFFRRLGCLFAIFNLFGVALFLVFLAVIAHLFGIVHFAPVVLQWSTPLGIVALAFLVAVIASAAFAMRRIFNPLDSLLEAADRIAEGDYTVHVPEKGPRGVRSLTRAFNNMAARLRETDEQRRNLLADVTHELRTPLTVIQGNLEGMLDGVYPADETNLRALLDETHLLSRLVEDLRTLALAESGALQLKKEPTDLVMLIRETLAAFQSQADAAGVALAVEAIELPLIELDPGRMRQVFSNLITNALRYSPAGSSVLVRCRLADGQVQVEVRDSGPGIPAEDLPHVFERFYKSADSGGTGLGLAIARHLVNAHGGTISAESAPGMGTTIRVVLPLTM
jgi:signal transduction histidine kinase